MIRPQIQQLTEMGPLPDSESATEEQLDRYDALFEDISIPVTDEEAEALAGLFGPDDCYGMAWTLIHMIETAPHWPLDKCLKSEENEWIDRLRSRAERGGRLTINSEHENVQSADNIS